MTEQMDGQMSVFDLDLWSGRTCQEHSVPTKEKILERSSKKPQKSQTKLPLFLDLRAENGHTPDVSWQMGGALLGEYTMHSFGECPSEERESRLSQILEAQPHPKYCLSAKACQGILRRAENRGKILPPMLDQALRRQAGLLGLLVSKNEQENQGGGKGILIQNERTGALSTLNNQPICFEPGAASRVGGHVYEDGVSGAVRANAGDNQQAVVYGMSAYDSNSMKSSNPHSGIYEADTTRTLDNNGGNPACNQGGMIVLEGNGSRPSHKGDGYAESEVSYTLNAVEQHAVCVENHPNDSRVKIADDGKVQTLSSRMGTGGGNVPMVMETEPILLANNQNEAEISQTGICNTLPAAMGMGGGYVPMITETYQKTTGSLCASGYNKLGTQEAANDMFVVEKSCFLDCGQTASTLTANNAGGNQRMPDKDNFNAVVQSMEVFHCTTENEKVQTLKARDYKDPQCVAVGVDLYNQSESVEQTKTLNASATDSDHIPCTYGLDRASYNQGINAQYDFAVEEERIGTQVAKGPGAVCGGSVVRRLTPMECERLQGYPDHWTDIGDWIDSKGKKHKGDSDSPRYKALGNSIALPFWEWMARRMVTHLEDNPTMASLFDGIGGFPVVFSRCGCKPVWASEIEEFPIAVTKLRFPD